MSSTYLYKCNTNSYEVYKRNIDKSVICIKWQFRQGQWEKRVLGYGLMVKWNGEDRGTWVV